MHDSLSETKNCQKKQGHLLVPAGIFGKEHGLEFNTRQGELR